MSVFNIARTGFIIILLFLAGMILLDTFVRKRGCSDFRLIGRFRQYVNWTGGTTANDGPRETADVLPGIRHILYINLDKRTDRREQFETEMLMFGIANTSYTRITGMAHKNGAVGCLMSHAKVMAYASVYYPGQHVLIFEDDIKFRQNRTIVEQRLSEFWKNDTVSDKWDILMLANNLVMSKPSGIPKLVRVIKAYTTSAYLVHADYVNTLLRTWHDALEGYEKHGFNNMYKSDVSWLKLQQKHRWFAFHPPLCIQRASYSDVEKRKVNYRM